MQLEISPELAELRTALRRFTTDKLEPIALEIDRTGEVPQQAFDALRTQGYLVTRVDTTMGSDAIKLAELTFEDCFVPDGAVLGEVGQGFKIAMDSLVSGGMGIVKGYPVERFYRDVRHYRIGEGSSEVQRMLIAREVLR